MLSILGWSTWINLQTSGWIGFATSSCHLPHCLVKIKAFSLHHARDSEDPEFIHLSCAAYLEMVYWESIESLLLGLLSGYMGLPRFTKIGDGSISTFWEQSLAQHFFASGSPLPTEPPASEPPATWILGRFVLGHPRDSQSLDFRWLDPHGMVAPLIKRKWFHQQSWNCEVNPPPGLDFTIHFLFILLFALWFDHQTNV